MCDSVCAIERDRLTDIDYVCARARVRGGEGRICVFVNVMNARICWPL